MTDRSITHATFSLEHAYEASLTRVFGAWADPAVKSRWFTGALDPGVARLKMDFRVGGIERAVSGGPGGAVVVYEGLFRDIIGDERIVVANYVDVDGERISVSQFTAEFCPDGTGTRLVVTEQGAYLDGHDSAESRAVGIRAQLRALAAELQDSAQ